MHGRGRAAQGFIVGIGLENRERADAEDILPLKEFYGASKACAIPLRRLAPLQWNENSSRFGLRFECVRPRQTSAVRTRGRDENAHARIARSRLSFMRWCSAYDFVDVRDCAHENMQPCGRRELSGLQRRKRSEDIDRRRGSVLII